MPEISFRKEALEKLTSPDQLDERVSLAPQKGWLALLGATILVVFATIWSIFAEIPVKIKAPGVFLLSGHAYVMSSSTDTKIVKWNVRNGDHVTKGQVLAIFENPELEAKLQIEKESLEDLKVHFSAWRQIQNQADRRWQKVLETSAKDLRVLLERISQKEGSAGVERARYELERTDSELKRIKSDSERSAALLDRRFAVEEMKRRIKLLEGKLKAETQLIAEREGIVLEIEVYAPARIEAGKDLVVLSPQGDPKKDLFAYAFIKPNDAPAVEPGQKVEIRVANYNAEQTGFLIGSVKSVSSTSLSANTINGTIPIPGLAKEITTKVSAAPHLVVLELEKEESSPTGYHWSGFDPSLPLTPGNSFTSSIILKHIRPISYVWPNFKRFL